MTAKKKLVTRYVCVHCGYVRGKHEKFYPNTHWFGAHNIPLKNRVDNRLKLCFECWMSISRGNSSILKNLHNACMAQRVFDFNQPAIWQRGRGKEAKE